MRPEGKNLNSSASLKMCATQKMLFTTWTGSGCVADRLKSSSRREIERHPIRCKGKRGDLRAALRGMMIVIMIGTAVVGALAAVATKDAGHAAHPTSAGPDALRVPETPVEGCMVVEEEAGARKTTGTGHPHVTTDDPLLGTPLTASPGPLLTPDPGPRGSPEGSLVPTPSP